MAKLEDIITNTTEGHFSLYGIILVSPLVVCIFCKLFKTDFYEFYDNHFLSIILGIILLRINCIYSGCCLGKVSDSFNGRYPVREIEIFLNVIYLCFYFLFKSRIKKGLSYPIYMIYYGIIRFIIQFYRANEGFYGTWFTFGHLWSIVSIVSGIICIVLITNNSKINSKEKLDYDLH